MADAPNTDDTPTAPDREVEPPPEPAGEQLAGMPRAQAIRLAQIGLIVVAILITGAVLLTRGGDDDAATGADGTDEAASDEPGPAEWPAAVRGRPPAFGATNDPPPGTIGDATPGIYVWSDFDGWHLWVANGEGLPAVRGTITSNDAVQKAELAVEGAGTANIADKVVTFELPAEPAVVGLDFNPGFYGKNLVFTLTGPDGTPIEASRVFLGKGATPAPFPLVLEKEPQD